MIKNKFMTVHEFIPRFIKMIDVKSASAEEAATQKINVNSLVSRLHWNIPAVNGITTEKADA